MCVEWVLYTLKRNTACSLSHYVPDLPALSLGQLAFSNSPARWARMLGVTWHMHFTLSSCLPLPGSCLGGRMWPIDPETKHKVPATAAEEGFAEETINQGLRSHQLKQDSSRKLILSERSTFGYKYLRKHVLRPIDLETSLFSKWCFVSPFPFLTQFPTFLPHRPCILWLSDLPL